jgi:hypothetical protein
LKTRLKAKETTSTLVFTVDGNEWQHQSYYESEDHPATEDVKFIPPNVPQVWPIENFWANLKKEGLHQQQLSSKRCKVLDGKDQRRAEVH